MKKLKLLPFLLLLIAAVYSCKEEEDGTPKPTDLVITETISNDKSGLVNFVAEAKNANYYNYYFGETANEKPIKSTDGKATYSYKSSGTYTVTVAAHSTENDSIVATKQITVEVNLAPTNVVVKETISTDFSGLVTFYVTANKATYFNFYFGAAEKESPTKSTNGMATFTYPASGTYTVTVSAHSTEKDSTVATKQISVVVGPKLANLVVNETVSTDGSGLVNFTSEAENADYYTYHFGTYEFQTPVESTDGAANFTYLQPGVYSVTVKAYGPNNQVISKSKTLTVNRPINNIGYTSPDTYAGMVKFWGEEFDGNSLNTSDWTHEIGTGNNGWGNNELQYYRAENTSVSNGFLTITAKKETFGGKAYTSSRLISRGKKYFQYGRVDVRALLPKGKGMWPAIWMLGEKINTIGWPHCGEIDIMELVGGKGKDHTVHGTVHWQADGGYANYGKPYSLPDDNFSNKFHVFSIIWDATKIEWYVDGVLFNVIDTRPAHLSEFRDNFFMLLNVAVGGNWPGSPDATTLFPQTMVVDYVRVFQNN